MFSHNRYSLSFCSTVDFRHSPSQLSVNDEMQKIRSSLFHTDDYVSLFLNRRLLSYTFDAGATVENLVAKGGNLMFSAYLKPKVEYKRGIVTLNVNLPMEWERFANQPKNFFHLSPHAFLDLRTGHHSEWYMYANYLEKAGGWADFAIGNYQMDYRTTMTTNGIIPETESLNLGICYNYKRPVKEFFWSCNADYNRSWRNTLVDMNISGGAYALKNVKHNHCSSSFSASSKLSKGFFDLHLKTLLDVNYSHSDGVQMSAGKCSDYAADVFTVSPQIAFTPKLCAVNYSADFVFNHLKTAGMDLHSLDNWAQRLSVTGTIGRVDFTYAISYDHNELQSARDVNVLLSDFSTVLRLKKLRLEASLRNIFNHRTYSVTSYSGILSSTDIYQLRPREIVITAQWTL